MTELEQVQAATIAEQAREIERLRASSSEMAKVYVYDYLCVMFGIKKDVISKVQDVKARAMIAVRPSAKV